MSIERSFFYKDGKREFCVIKYTDSQDGSVTIERKKCGDGCTELTLCSLLPRDIKFQRSGENYAAHYQAPKVL